MKCFLEIEKKCQQNSRFSFFLCIIGHTLNSALEKVEKGEKIETEKMSDFGSTRAGNPPSPGTPESNSIKEPSPSEISNLREYLQTATEDLPDLRLHATEGHQSYAIASSIENLMNEPGTVAYSMEARQTIMTAIRLFVSDVVKRTMEETAPAESKRRNTARDMEVQDLHAELEYLFVENAALDRKMKQAKLEREREVANEKTKADKLKDECAVLKDKVRLECSSKERLQKQLKGMNQEALELQKELADVKSELEEKEQKVDQLTDELRKQVLRVKELEIENQKMSVLNGHLKRKKQAIEKSVEGLSNGEVLEGEISKLRCALDQSMSLNEQQTSEIMELTRSWKLASKTCTLATQVLSEYDRCLEKANHEIEVLKAKQSSVEETPHVCEVSNDYTGLVDQLREMSGKETVGDLLVYLIKMQEVNVPKLQKENEVLKEIVNSQLMFMKNFAKTGKLDFTLMRERNTNLSKESEDLLVEVAKTRQFLNSHDIDCANCEISLETLKVLCSDDTCQDFLSTCLAFSSMMQKCCEKAIEEHKEIEWWLSKIATLLNISGSNTDICNEIVSEIHKQIAIRTEILALLPDEHVDGLDETSRILEIAQKVSTIVHQLDTDVRSVLEYRGAVSDIPQVVVSELVELKTCQPPQECVSVDDLKSLEETRQALEVEVSQAQETIQSLEQSNEVIRAELSQTSEELKTTRDNLQDLQKKYHEANAKSADYQTRYKTLLITRDKLEEDIERLMKDKKELQALMDEKFQSFDMRIAAIIEEQKQQHKSELENQAAVYQSKLDKVLSELSSKRERLHLMKAKFKEAIQTYDTAFAKQKQAVSTIRKQNDKLTKALEQEQQRNSQSTTQTTPNTLSYEAQIRTLTSEKEVLTARVSHLQEQCAQIQAARDAFWETETSIREATIRSQLTSEAITARTNYQTLLHDLSQLVSDATHKPITTDLPSIKSGITFLSRRVNDLEDHISSLQTLIVERQLSDWATWARKLCSCVTDSATATASPDELKSIITDLVIASAGKAT